MIFSMNQSTGLLAVAVLSLTLLACQETPAVDETSIAQIPPTPEGHATAIFAGGCFWCMEPPFDAVDGVTMTVVGFSGGTIPDPTYRQVVGGGTGHREAVYIIYDPAVVSYRELVDTFWRTIDPTQTDGQFADRGEHYQTAIFVENDQQRADAEASRQALADSGIFSRPIATVVLDRLPFYPAEEYHQNYYQKNVLHYKRYKVGSGRAGFIERTWGDDNK